MVDISAGNCRSFCACSFFHTIEVPRQLEDFAKKKLGKPKLPKELERFLNPRVGYATMTGALTVDSSISVRFSQKEIVKRVEELKRYKLSRKFQKKLLEFEKTIESQAKGFVKPEQNRVLFRFEATPKPGGSGSIGIRALEECLKEKEIKVFFNIIRETWVKPLHATVCAEHEYEAGSFRFTGGLVLPTQLPLPADLGTKLGVSELDGISIRFKQSIIGLEDILLSLENDKTIVVASKASYEISDPVEMLKKGYELSNRIANLLVEKVV